MKQGWMRSVCAGVVFAAAACSGWGQQQAGRPHITGISHMAVYASDPAAAEHFYAGILGASKGVDPETAAGARYYFSPAQFVEVLPLPPGQGISRMDHTAWNTDDVNGMHSYLSSKHTPGITAVQTGSDGSRWFEVKDPEGNRVQFVQGSGANAGIVSTDPISSRVIHVGFLVRNKAAEDQFYKDVLGFRPYWYGAMQPGKVDWVSQQVPDGYDWLEYMMAGDGSDTPSADRVDARQLGVLNHFSLGVPNMEQAMTTLISADRLSPRHDGPQMGKDGKWQANLYDPDGTRVELMEFQPVMKPCCSGFTAESPTK